jgi:hypothetical protein
LLIAADFGFCDLVRLLVTECGANINQVCADINNGLTDVGTPLSMAAFQGHLDVVRCLVELGAEIGTVDSDGCTALLNSAIVGQYSTMQYLLEEADAKIEDVNDDGDSAWSLLIRHIERGSDEKYDLVARTVLLRVMVLRGAPPPALVALLSPEDTYIVQERALLQARLPAYLAHRRAAPTWTRARALPTHLSFA